MPGGRKCLQIDIWELSELFALMKVKWISATYWIFIQQIFIKDDYIIATMLGVENKILKKFKKRDSLCPHRGCYPGRDTDTNIRV